MTAATAPLAGRHALITGANRGIGAAIARAFSRAGARVTLLVRDVARARSVAETLVGDHTIVSADVTNRAATLTACAKAASALGPIDVLVNNAGSAESAPFTKSDVALFARMIEVHLMAAVHTTHAVLPSMLERQRGHVINIASIAGLTGAPYITAYTSAKHALVGLTRSLAAEVAGRGIVVHAVCPGYTDTDLVQDAATRVAGRTGRTADEARRSILADAGQARMLTVHEVAAVTLALCVTPTDEPTGQIVTLDGSSAV